MTRIPIAIIYFLFSLFSFGQEPSTQITDPIRIGLSFSLEHVDRKVSRDGPPQAGGLYDDRGSRSHRIGYSAGIDVRVPVSGRLSFLTGARYADQGFSSRILVQALDSLQQELPPDGPDPVSGTEITHGYHFQYLDVPMVLRLQFGERRLRPVISAGVHTSYLMGVYRVVYNEIPDGPNDKQRVDDEFSFNQINIFPTIGFGLIHLSTDRIWTRLDLAGHYGALAVTGGPERGNLWNAGILMGVFYSFRAP